MKRQKIVLTPSLKADDYMDGNVVIASGFIKAINAVKTKFDDDNTTSTVVVITDETETNKDKKEKSVFANSTSINNLIEGFGEEDSLWLNKGVRVICNKQNYLNKKQLVIECLK